MKAKDNELLTQNQRLGYAIRRIRESRKVSALFVSTKLGYKNESTYCRMEHGEIENISIWTILAFCKLLDCNIVHLFKLAEIDIFETQLKNWSEFYVSLANLPDEEAAELLELSNKISPPLQN